MSLQTLHHLYAAIAPWSAFSLLLLGRGPYLSRTRIIGSLWLAFFLLLIPIGGWSSFQWIMVLEPNPSYTLTALLAVALFQRVGRVQLFSPEDWKAAWCFGALASLILYPMGLGLSSMDPYVLGWRFVLPVAVALVGIVLILRGNRFGVILLLPFIGFLLGLQESQNFWDAVIDPFYGGVAILIAPGICWQSIRRRKSL